MSNTFRNMGLYARTALMGAASVIITAFALVILAVWQSGQYNRLAQTEVENLIHADLDHITQGVYNLVRTENEAVQEQVDYNLNVIRHLLENAGKPSLSGDTMEWTVKNQFTNEIEPLRLPRFLIGDTWIAKNADPDIETPIVDEVTRLVGETATIFQRMNERGDMLRIATTVRTRQGERALGTYIPAVNPDGTKNPVVSAVLEGKTYHGRAYVVSEWYLTAYEPLHDTRGDLMGMLYVGVRQKAVESRIRNAILQTRVGQTGYVYVLGGKGEDRGKYIVSYKGERDGEDIWASIDSEGRYFIQEIISKAVTLGPKEMTTVRYPWKNPGEEQARWKVARIAYYAPWDWVIGTSVYEDELQTYRTVLTDGRLRMTRIMGMAGIIITILAAMICILITWTITRPVRQITEVAEKIIDGDLDQVVEVDSSDEIGVLARTFNLMTGKLKQSMENLSKSEEKYRGIFENALEGLFQSTFDGHIISANPAMAHILGYDSPEELISSITDIRKQLYISPQDRDNRTRRTLEPDEVLRFEVQFYRRDRVKIWVSISARTIYDDNGKPAYIEGFITDISDRKKAEEDLAESRDYLDEIINTVADPMFVKDRHHRWVLVNNALCAFMGHERSEILGKSDYDYFPKEEADVFWEKDEFVLTSGKENINEESLTDALGIVHTIITKKTLYTGKNGEKFIVGIIRDITDQKLAEEEKKQLQVRLNHAQKMEAIGTLAGGIAHDFNNILSAILGYTELAMDYIPKQGKGKFELMEVLKASNRARALVKQILTFSRMTETEYSPIALSTVIKESIRMLRSVIPSNIEIRQDLNAKGLVMSDPTQINQVMINLCTNAAHAMDETGGILEVRLHEVTVDNSAASSGLDIAPGPYVKITVSDTGMGIPEEIRERIFEPYFTTKELGRGTGLGLSVVHGIAKNHNGTVTCRSSPNEGTTFDVYLPRIMSGREKAEQEVKIDLPTGKERILFIDDEEVLTDLAEKMIGGRGYTVVPMTDSVKALELFRSDPQGFDLVITDMTMPGITGDQLAREIITVRHDIPVILCTGYNIHISEEKAKRIGIREFLLKPLDMKTLIKTIRRVLDEKDEPG